MRAMTMAAPDTNTMLYPRRWWAFVVLSLCLLVIVLDNTVLNVALPTLARDLAATASQLQWMVDAYVLVFAGLLLTAGSLGDRFGRKRALLTGLAIFGASSFWAAHAGSSAHLIAARAVMGLGGALIMPATLSITTNMFPPAERTKAIGAWAGIAGLGIVIGPLTGGWLLGHFTWGAVFLINLPVIAVALLTGWLLVPESRDPAAPTLDPLGALLSITGLGALLYAIIEVPAAGWTDQRVLIAFAVAALLLAAFIGWELRAPTPLLNMRLFRNPRFSAASLALTLVSFALFGSFFFLTQYLQVVLGYTALEAGARLIPLAGGLLLGAGLSTKLVGRVGTKLAVGSGLLIVAGALALLATTSPASGYRLLVTVLVILGFGLGATMAPATDSIMGALPLAHAGVGSAVNDTTRQVGGALGVAVLGSLLAGWYRGTMADSAAVHALSAPAAALARDTIVKAAAVASQLGGQSGAAVLAAAQRAFISAMDRTVLVAAGVAVLGALVAFCFLPAQAAVQPAPGAAGAETEPGAAKPELVEV